MIDIILIRIILILLGIPVIFIAIVGSWILAIDLAATMLGIK